MADLNQDDENKKDDITGNQAQSQSQAQGPQSIGAGGISGASGASGASGSAMTNTGPGAGGGGWVNLQNYLGANQNSTGTSDYMKNQVGNEFQTNQSNLDKDSAAATSQGANQVSGQTNLDQASKLIQAGDPNAASSIKNTLSQNYSGPTGFSENMTTAAQDYGSQLDPNNQTGYNTLLNNLYDKSAGGAMGSGMKALQQNLDYNNSALQGTRQNLLDQYSGLQNNYNNTNASTNNALSNDAQQYGQNKSNLYSGLTNMAQGLAPAAQQQADDAAKNVNSTTFAQGPGELSQYNQIAAALGLAPISAVSTPVPTQNVQQDPDMQRPLNVSNIFNPPSVKPHVGTYGDQNKPALTGF